MPDKTLEQITRDDARSYMLRPKTSFAFAIGRDDDDKPTRESVKNERAALKALRERAMIALDMTPGQQRDLEITRLYRALVERQCIAEMMHAGTREHHVIRWAYKDAYSN